MISFPNIVEDSCPPTSRQAIGNQETDTCGGDGGSGGGGGGGLDDPYLIIKPSSVGTNIGGVLQFDAYYWTPAGETLIQAGVVFTSGTPAILSINATTGNATGLAAGIVTVEAAWNGLTAYAQVTVMSGPGFCDGIVAAMYLMIDDSKSMSINYGAGHGTRLDFARELAGDFLDEINFVKDKAGFSGFDVASQNASSPSFTQVESDVTPLLNALPQTQLLTKLTLVQSGLIALTNTTADRRALILFSDGEDTASSDLTPLLASASSFKSAGGIILVVGLRASGAGFTLLSKLSSGGFFINALPENASLVPGWLSGLKGYFCAGSCGLTGVSGYGDGCPDASIPPQIEELNPPEPVEEGSPPPGIYTSTKSFTAVCTYADGVGSAVPVMTSNSAPSGTVTYSGQMAGYEGYKAFGTGPGWRVNDQIGWLAYQFTSPQVIASFAIATQGAVTENFQYYWWIEGSNDGLAWTKLAHHQYAELSEGDTEYLPIDTPGSYTHYRLRYQLAGGGPVFGVTRLTLYDAANALTRTATRTSSISQADADQKAYNAAKMAAQAAIVCCSNAIEIVDNSPANPFPACYQLDGFTGTVANIAVHINGFKHAYPSDVCMVLVGPGGQCIRLMSGCGAGHSIAGTGINMVFDDSGIAMSSAALVSTTYKPTALDGGIPPLPCPQIFNGTTLSVFNGINPNGKWRLFILDTKGLDAGSIDSWTVVAT